MIDRSLGRDDTRSAFVEAAVVHFLAEKARKEREARDRAILDANADRLNAEAADVLRYQVRG
ncbi:MAG: hypothetical protein HYY84_11700 [Deltaproteobacteria bacterium]|nr:hypothetical protein [Deltaproteobacteria bacterium]